MKMKLVVALTISLAYFSKPVCADECPLPVHRDAKGHPSISVDEIATYFASIKPIIFLGRIEVMTLKGRVDDDPVVTVQYRVMDRVRGDLPDEFSADRTLWCDACGEEALRRVAAGYVGQKGIVMGSLAPGAPISAFKTGGCFEFVPTDFMQTGDRLLPALRAAVRKSSRSPSLR